MKMREGGDAYSSGDDAKVIRSLMKSLASAIVLIMHEQAGDGEIEVAPGFSLSQQIGIVVGCIVEDENSFLLDTIKEASLSIVSPFNLPADANST